MSELNQLLLTELPASFFESDRYKSAITHKSFFFESGQERPHNERLEFLGDAVLSLSVASTLYEIYPQNDEGFLTKARSSLVNTKSLSEKCKALGLFDQIRVGKSERGEIGVWQPRVLASTLEALFGALFLELGFEKTKGFIQKLFAEEFASEEALKVSESDWKSRLQEDLQREFQKTPTYEVLATSGPDHQRSFRVGVLFDEKILAEGQGSSRKDAEQQAARKALEEREISRQNDKGESSND